MAKKFYVVWVGRDTGVFTSWPQTHKLIDKFPKARYKSFPTREEAEAAFVNGPSFSAASSSSKPGAGSAKTAKGSQSLTAVDHTKFDVSIYCDGGCDPNPGKSGSGVAVYHKTELAELWYGLYNPMGTNNTAELNALYQSLLIADEVIKRGETVHVLCDSKYSIDSITNWAFGWKAKGWTKKSGEIKNLAIIQQAHELFVTISEKVVVSHVKAHIGIEGNELADRMSIVAIDRCDVAFCRYPEPVELSAILALRAG
ncbi:MAG: viroplasmin family protein [Pseudomonadales bacterium]|nr:viroplasmin family protein [Pseudomonadales bacterium]